MKQGNCERASYMRIGGTMALPGVVALAAALLFWSAGDSVAAMCNPPGATNVTIEITAELSVCVGCDATATVTASGQLGSTPINVMLTETNNGTGDIDLSTNSLSLTGANPSTNFTVSGVTASSSLFDTKVVATVTGEGGTNCVAEMEVTIIKVEFTNRVGKINYGFDPDYCLKSETPWPWTSVDKDGTNEVCSLMIEPASAANQIEVVMASGASCAEVSPTNFTAGSTDLTITGQGSGGDALAEARIKGTTTACAKLNIMAQTNRTLTVGVYYVQDPASTNTFPVGGPSATSVVATLNDVYQQAQITWELAESATTNFPYDSTSVTNATMYDGIFQANEIGAIDLNSTAGWSGDLNILFIKKSGIPYTNTPPLNAYFIRGIGLIYRDTYDEFGGIIFTDDAAGYADLGVAHEFGHSLNLPKMGDSAAHDHDSPPWPTGEESLMRDGWPESDGVGGYTLPVPGRWLRHEDWEESNISTEDL